MKFLSSVCSLRNELHMMVQNSDDIIILIQVEKKTVSSCCFVLTSYGYPTCPIVLSCFNFAPSDVESC